MTDSEVGSYKAGVRISRYLFDENMSVCVCSSLLSDGVNGVNENDAPSLCNKMEIGQSSVLLAARSDSNVRGGGLISLLSPAELHAGLLLADKLVSTLSLFRFPLLKVQF